MDLHGETVLEVLGDSNKSLSGLAMGSTYKFLKEHFLLKHSVAIKVILGGRFQFPENRQLISAIFWISSSTMFLKEVAVNIQHCAVIKNEEQCSTFRFIIAKCSQKLLPYRFREREGLFNPHTHYGVIMQAKTIFTNWGYST